MSKALCFPTHTRFDELPLSERLDFLSNELQDSMQWADSKAHKAGPMFYALMAVQVLIAEDVRKLRDGEKELTNDRLGSLGQSFKTMKFLFEDALQGPTHPEDPGSDRSEAILRGIIAAL